MSLLDTLARGGHLRTLDLALASTLRRLDPSTPELVLAGAALASLAVAHGHAGFAARAVTTSAGTARKQRRAASAHDGPRLIG